MRNILAIFVLSALIISCSPAPRDEAIVKIGNTALFQSDAEFLASTKPEIYRNKKALVAELQQAAEARRTAEVARTLFAGEENSIQKNLSESEEARLARVYFHFYLNANLGQTNKTLQDYYKKNKNRYADSSDLSISMPFTFFRERIAADFFLEKNPELAAHVNDSNKAMVIDSCRREILSSELDRLKKHYNVELVKIEPPGIEDYYKANPDQFQTKTQYKLLNLSDADSAALAKKIKGIFTREDFAKIAVEMPLAKQGHFVMGVGMLPTLDAEISRLGAKKFTPILRSYDTQAYHVFYIDSIIPPQLKPWDRAKSLAKSIVENQGDVPLDSSTVLATINGNPLITEKDVLELREKIHPMRRLEYNRDMILKDLIEKSLYARAAKEKGLDKNPEFIAWTRQITDRAYAQVLTDSLLTRTLGVPEDSLKAAYEAEKDSLFPQMDFEHSKLPVAVWLRIPDLSYRKEFVINRDNYGDAPNWESAKRAIYRNIRYFELSGIQERVLANFLKSIPVTIIDASWELEFLPNNFAELAAQAITEYENRNLQKARTAWEKVKILFPQSDSIQKAAFYELANIYQELGLYSLAVDEYKAIAGIWPNDSETYKAYFMQGFVLSEYEKKDSLALIAFEEMLEKFPNSELSDDAKMMVANIKSGGKVFEDLIKKIESSSE
jgi:hypothetical protein|uniref:Uncharacterized protein n=1 Tax=uncultured bacterium contig00092 TaxID=1181563 RepID=A0A806K2Y6_9BACT|nr:hypothetical protein [uncultured bacterium contig00092]